MTPKTRTLTTTLWAVAILGMCALLASWTTSHILANRTSFDALKEIDPQKIFLVQLSDFMWHELRSPEDRLDTARHYRVFPGEGVHSDELMRFVRTIDDMGYRGDYSFEVFNDDFKQMPLAMVAGRARQSVKWITDQVSRRSLPARRKA